MKHIPPHNIEAEKELLGALISESSLYDDIQEAVNTADIFFKEEHKIIFSAFKDMYNAGSSIDMITLTSELTSRGVLDGAGGAYTVAQLYANASRITTGQAVSYALILKEQYLRREIEKRCMQIVGKAKDIEMDVFTLLDEAESLICSLNEQVSTSEMKSLEEIYVEVVQDLEQKKHATTGITGVDTGYANINYVTSGWQKEDLIILAARPSVGKTAFSLNLALNAIQADEPTNVAFFSLEMSKEKIATRIMSNFLDIPLRDLKVPRNLSELYWNKLTGTFKFGNARIFIDDQAGVTPTQIKSRVKTLIRNQSKVDKTAKNWIIIIDYLQLMTLGNERNMNREQVISTISRSLKAIGKELKVPVIALSQLSRDLEKRSGDQKEPQLSDLRESGAIEQDADVVSFLFRPEYHGLSTTADGDTLPDGYTKLTIKKNRNGELADLEFIADLSKQRFLDKSIVDGMNFSKLPQKENYSQDNLFQDEPPF